jgi:hypothetical protein
MFCAPPKRKSEPNPRPERIAFRCEPRELSASTFVGKRVRVTSPGKDRQFGTADDVAK